MKYLLLLFTLFFTLGSEIAFGQSQNYLINGGFDLWQRGSVNAKLTSPVDTKGYLADRWFATAGTYDRNASNLPTGHKYGAQLALSSASGWLCQRIEIENVRYLSGQKMTISGYERSSSGTSSLKIKIDRPNTIDDYGDVGKTGTTVTNELAATTLLTSTSTTLTPWRYTFTVSANMASYGFQVCLGTDSSVTNTYQLSAIMLNEGMKKLSFRRAGSNITEEIILVQRYYEKTYSIDIDPGTGTGTGRFTSSGVSGSALTTNEMYTSTIFAVSKRGIPYSVKIYDVAGNGPGKMTRANIQTSSSDNQAGYAGTASTHGMGLFGETSGLFNANAFWCHYTADAEL